MYVLMPFVWNVEVESWMPVLTKDHVVFLARLKGVILVKFHFEYLHLAYFNSPEVSAVHCVLPGFFCNVSALPSYDCISVAHSVMGLSTLHGSVLLLLPLLTQLSHPRGPFHWNLNKTGLGRLDVQQGRTFHLFLFFFSVLRHPGKKVLCK